MTIEAIESLGVKAMREGQMIADKKAKWRPIEDAIENRLRFYAHDYGDQYNGNAITEINIPRAAWYIAQLLRESGIDPAWIRVKNKN